MPKIFISYRRTDSAPVVGRIYERLAREFGKSNVFYDIQGIGKGEDFANVLRQNVASCDVLLAIIGSQWTSVIDSNGNKRLFNEDDYVRYEVDTALRIPKITVIPVLISDASMPSKSDLPSVLQDLTRLNAVKVRNDPDFNHDMDELVKAVKPSRLRTLILIAALLAFILIAAVVFVISRPSNDPTPTPTTQSAAIIATNTDAPIPPTSTDSSTPTLPPPTATDLPTATPVPPTAVPTNTPIPPTDNPTNTPIPPTATLPPSPTLANGQLHLYATHDSLTLRTTEALSLAGFQFGVIVDGELTLHTLADSFDALKLTGGRVNINDCYVYAANGTTSPLEQACTGQVFRTTVAAVDVFWYDSVANTPRNIAIFRESETTGIICSATTPDCAIAWLDNIVPTVAPNATSVPATSVVKTFACEVTIIGYSSIDLNVVHANSSKTSPMRNTIKQGTLVIIRSVVSERPNEVWYQISDTDNKILGWILSDYVNPTENCP